MNGSIRCGNLLGIPFYIHPSWFFLLGWLSLVFGANLADNSESAGGLSVLLGFVCALLFFASIVASVLVRNFIGIRWGRNIQSISLLLFGFQCQTAIGNPKLYTPAAEFWFAITGPAVNLGLFALLMMIGVNTRFSQPLATLVKLLAESNLIFALFNLLPLFPLPGGEILKSLVWKVTGSQYKGKIFAIRIAQLGFGVAIVLGLLSVLGITSILEHSIFGSVWIILICGFLFIQANNSLKMAEIEKIMSLKAGEIVMPSSPIVLANLSIMELADDSDFEVSKWRKFFVTNEEGHLLGVVDVNDLEAVSKFRWSTTSLGDVMQPVDPATIVQENQSLLVLSDKILLVQQQQLPYLIIVSDNGVLMGLLDVSLIISLLRKNN